MKKLFRDYTYSWRQIAIFKLAMVSIGIIIGALLPIFFRNLIVLIIVLIIAIVSSVYIAIVSFRHKKID